MPSDRKRFVEDLVGISFDRPDADIANTLQVGGGKPQLRVVDGITEYWNEDLKAWQLQPRHPAGTSKGGQWSGGPSASLYGPRTPDGWTATTSSGGGHWSSRPHRGPDTSHGLPARAAAALDAPDVTPADRAFAERHLEMGVPVIVVNQRDLDSILERGVVPAREIGKTTRAYSISEREAWEDSIFGAQSERPVYGAMDVGGETAERLAWYGYGNAALRLKSDAMEKATATWGDSLNNNMALTNSSFDEASLRRVATINPPSRAFDPKNTDDALNALVVSRYGASRADDRNPMEYLELQFWGGVKPSQIDSVTFFRTTPSRKLTEELDRRGIRWYDKSQTHDGSATMMADSKGKVLARNPETGATLIDRGVRGGIQMASISGDDSGRVMPLESFLKFGGWEAAK